jgi:hypothetical protein
MIRTLLGGMAAGAWLNVEKEGFAGCPKMVGGRKAKKAGSLCIAYAEAVRLFTLNYESLFSVADC